MAKPKKRTVVLLALLLAIGLFELAGVLSHGPRPRTISEYLARWFPKRWRRALLIGLMALLTWHFWAQPQVRPVPSIPVCEGVVACP